jgi:hypothetical protein
MKRLILALFGMLSVVLTIMWWRSRDECSVIRRVQTDDGMIEIVDPACKEGLPHTTDQHTIRMTEDIHSGPDRDRILVHERVHLDQRRHPAIWRDFYKRAWSYTLLTEPPAELRKYVNDYRPNPDTADSPWAVWRDRYVFFPMRGRDGGLRNAEVKIWDLETHAFVTLPATWRDMFCATSDKCVHQYEHPHEIAAEYIADGSLAPAAQKLFAWKR